MEKRSMDRAGRASHMDLVTLDGGSAQLTPDTGQVVTYKSACADQPFGVTEVSRYRWERKAGSRPVLRPQANRIGNGLTEHLIATTDAQNRSTVLRQPAY